MRYGNLWVNLCRMKARLTAVRRESEFVKTFEFQALDRDRLNFIPGQFVIITIPGLPEFNNTRSYSICSAPMGNAKFELCISINPKGKATPVLWGLQTGDILDMSEPQGNFILRESGNLEVVFICTGTGVAPFRSMIKNLIQKGSLPGKTTLIFGCRFENDILYRKEFEEISVNHLEFNYIPVLSRDSEWTGKKGYVHSVYQPLFSDGRDARFYVCGWQEMCRDTRRNLKEMGYNRQQYFFELYD